MHLGKAALHLGDGFLQAGALLREGGLAVFQFGDVGFGAGLPFGHCRYDAEDLLHRGGQVGDDFGQPEELLAEEMQAQRFPKVRVALQHIQDVLEGVDGDQGDSGHRHS